MNNYYEQLNTLGLFVTPSGAYEGAEKHAQNFKRCSILEDKAVSYSAHSQTTNETARASDGVVATR